MTCLFCENEVKGNLTKGTDVLCGGCVCKLFGADQDALKGAYAKSVEKGYDRKATALKMFIIQEAKNGRDIKRHHNRTGTHRFSTHHQGRFERTAIQERLAVL